ncbi:hypothetical protein Tco_0787661 [Tanacetum coccineum]
MTDGKKGSIKSNEREECPSIWKIALATTSATAAATATTSTATAKDGILDSWMKEEWQRRSRAGAENRKKVLGDLEVADGVGGDLVDGVGVDSPSDVPFNPKAWEKAIGTSYDSTPINNEAIIEAQVNARVESRLQDVRIEMEEMKIMLKELQNTNASKE